jgi:hypothetical protein
MESSILPIPLPAIRKSSRLIIPAETRCNLPPHKATLAETINLIEDSYCPILKNNNV